MGLRCDLRVGMVVEWSTDRFLYLVGNTLEVWRNCGFGDTLDVGFFRFSSTSGRG